MKNIISYKKLYPKISVSAKVSAICGIGSIVIGTSEYPGIGIGRNFGIDAAIVFTLRHNK